METIKRMPICRILSKQQRKWLNSNCCPICGLPKSEWKRRIDWTCCSTKCTKRYSEGVIFVWQYWKIKVFKRDNFTCVKCGDNPTNLKERYEGESDEDFKWRAETYDGDIFIKYVENGYITQDSSKLIGDHIIPIAIGGEEYDLDNVQTLCIKCNKIKTKEDMKKIALYRKQHISQTKLGSSQKPPIVKQ